MRFIIFLKYLLFLSLLSCIKNISNYEVLEKKTKKNDKCNDNYIIAVERPDQNILSFNYDKSSQILDFYNYMESKGLFVNDPKITDLKFLLNMDIKNSKLHYEGNDLKKDLFNINFFQDQIQIASIFSVNAKNLKNPRKYFNNLKDKIIYFEKENCHFLNYNNLNTSDLFEHQSKAKNNYWHNNINLFEGLKLLASKMNDINTKHIAGVLDSGVDCQHEFLKGKCTVIEENVGKDLNCYSDGSFQNEQYGCDVTTNKEGMIGSGDFAYPYNAGGFNLICPEEYEENPRENKKRYNTCVHGTHIAGIISGNLYSIGGKKNIYPGICQFCEILNIKVIAEGDDKRSGKASDYDINQGLELFGKFRTIMIEQNPDQKFIFTINYSLGKYQKSITTTNLITSLNKLEIVAVVAASNENSLISAYPGALVNSISVAALDQNNDKASFSNFGPTIDISAPGKNIGSTIPGIENLLKIDGTSQAAPIVLAGLNIVWATKPSLSAKQITNLIKNTANPKIYNRPFNKNLRLNHPSFGMVNPLGTGILDIENAIKNIDNQNLYKDKTIDRIFGCTIFENEQTKKSGHVFLIIMMFFPYFFKIFDKFIRLLQSVFIK